MRVLTLFLIATLSVVVIGCDGDGDGTTTEETETVDQTDGTFTLDSGSATIAPGDSPVVSSFSVFETGIIEGKVEWNTGPSKLHLYLVHESSATSSRHSAESPATVLMEVTEYLLDNGNDWVLRIYNPDTDTAAALGYTVTHTPD
jgi:hypothetical protein